jgi:membrane-bound serine protease (ClpP class)
MNISLISLATVLVAGLCVILYIAAVSRHKKASMGELNLIGAVASAETALEPEGSILVHGEMWRARSRTGATIERGQRVRVVGASSYLLEVEPLG